MVHGTAFSSVSYRHILSKGFIKIGFLACLAFHLTDTSSAQAKTVLSDAPLPNFYDEVVRGEAPVRVASLDPKSVRVSALITPSPEDNNTSLSRSIELPNVVSAYGAPINCLPKDLKTVLNKVSVRFGQVSILSSHRSHSSNRRAGGARESYHLSCRAVDFRVKGANARKVMAFIDQHPLVGGRKLYSRGFIHIDNGPVRTWAERRSYRRYVRVASRR